jgi:hypothetical protein
MTDAAAETAAAVLTLNQLGEFFAVEQLSGHPDGRSWRRLVALSDPAVLHAEVGDARRSMADRAGIDGSAVEERAAASIVLLGWSARLLSPVLGLAVTAEIVPRMSLVGWRAGRRPPFVAFPDGALITARSIDEVVELIRQEVLDPVVAPLVDAVAGTFGVSTTLLWGNVASASVGSAGRLAALRPDLVDRSRAVVDATLADAPLAGRGRFVRTPGGLERFRRNSCCLYYRLPGGGYCGDCVLIGRGTEDS